MSATTDVNFTPTLIPRTNITPNGQPKPKGLCTRLAYGTASCVKHFGLGIAAMSILTPLASGISYFAQLSGLTPEVTVESNIRGLVANYQKMGLTGMNADILVNAPCYMEEAVRQLNLHVRETPTGWQPLNYNVLTLKAEIVGAIVIGSPFKEEILFRGLIQDVCLTRIPKYIIKKIAPGRETVLDTTIAKAARILLTSAAFSASHLNNQGLLADS